MKKNSANLHVVRSPNQWDKLNHQIASTVRQLVNGDEPSAHALASLVDLIYKEEAPFQEIVVREIIKCAFVGTCEFDDVMNAWLGGSATQKSEAVRRRG
jgi:hypothetical protein